MTGTPFERDIGRVCELIATRRRAGKRTMVGIAGPPASGKSTLAQAVVAALNAPAPDNGPEAVLLPMDGYHLDNRILNARGVLARKGAPETFDAEGFCRAVAAIATARVETFHPRFDRRMDVAIANAIAIAPDIPVVVAEGNYLLLTAQPWATLHRIFDATVFLCPPRATLEDRLLRRWMHYGLDHKAALRRTIDNDMPNADTVTGGSCAADLHLGQNDTGGDDRFTP
ncbi:MAG: uridine kinase [Rhodobacteraceae bacterium]|nr:uridine kinase [Paracoccaceae bacterium]